MKKSCETSFLPWEKSALMAAFALPLLSVTIASYLHFPVAPLVIVWLYYVIAQRLLGSCRKRTSITAISQTV